jgi:WD40 repeat protein
MLFIRSPAGEWNFTTALKTDSDILTVEWLSHTVIALGQRDGKIRLHDTRSTGSSHVLTHPVPIGKIRRADDPTRIVAAGIEDTLFLYDIRSPQWTGGMADARNQHYNRQYFAERETNFRPAKKRKLMMGARKWYVSPISDTVIAIGVATVGYTSLTCPSTGHNP